MKTVSSINLGMGLKALIVVLSIAMVGCSDSDSDAGLEPAANAPEPELSRTPFQELLDQGVDRYLGAYTPMLSVETDGVIAHQFGAGDGPLCLDGSEYSMSTRDQGSEHLVIFLNGGGACWPALCAATEQADPTIIEGGILDANSATNPVADWNLAYFPYCDGSLHSGDADYDYDTDEDGTDDRFHRGLHNLSAGLDVTAQTFPQPSRILLSGASGGGYGTIFALSLVRTLYPDALIEVINDSGLGVVPADDPSATALLEYWNNAMFLPESCPDCVSDGHSTNMFNWFLNEDESLRIAATSYLQDFVIGTFFTGLGNPAFADLLQSSLADIEAMHPDRFHSFLKNGASHTFLRDDLTVSVGDVSVSEWLDNFLFGTEEWVTVLEE